MGQTGNLSLRRRQLRDLDMSEQLDMGYPSQEVELTLKVVLLGTGYSGKSTLFAQVVHNLQHGKENAVCEECLGHSAELYTKSVRIYVLSIMLRLLKDSTELNLSEHEQMITSSIKLLRKAGTKVSDLRVGDILEVGNIITGIRSPPTKLPPQSEHLSYFLDRMEHIFSKTYLPTRDDLLRSKIRSTGISAATVDVCFSNRDWAFEIIDVAGEKSERRKWSPLLPDTDYLQYCLSAVDLLDEDPECLAELQNYMDVLHEPEFTLSILITKTDLLREKLGDSTDGFLQEVKDRISEMALKSKVTVNNINTVNLLDDGEFRNLVSKQLKFIGGLLEDH